MDSGFAIRIGGLQHALQKRGPPLQTAAPQHIIVRQRQTSLLIAALSGRNRFGLEMSPYICLGARIPVFRIIRSINSFKEIYAVV
jgi:hypothetical protein